MAGSLTIDRAALTITALPASKVQDGAPYSGGAGVSYAGFVPGQGVSSLMGLLGYAGSSQGAVNAGSYTLIPFGLTSSNYDITYVGGMLTIAPGGDTVDPIPYLLPPVKPNPFLVLTLPVVSTQPVSLGVGGLNYVAVEAPPAQAPQASAPSSGPTTASEGSTDNGGPRDATALPRSIKGPTDVFIIRGGLNVGAGVLVAE